MELQLCWKLYVLSSGLRLVFFQGGGLYILHMHKCHLRKVISEDARNFCY